jgi:hypothetical protein
MPVHPHLTALCRRDDGPAEPREFTRHVSRPAVPDASAFLTEGMSGHAATLTDTQVESNLDISAERSALARRLAVADRRSMS